jgi:hypothetical protein
MSHWDLAPHTGVLEWSLVVGYSLVLLMPALLPMLILLAELGWDFRKVCQVGARGVINIAANSLSHCKKNDLFYQSICYPLRLLKNSSGCHLR